MSALPASLTEQLHRRENDRQALFRTYNDLRRQARDSEDFELHRLVGEAYQAFMRTWLDEDLTRIVELEEEVARLRGELQQWRAGIKRNEP
jgi:hypothetical protein